MCEEVVRRPGRKDSLAGNKKLKEKR